MTGSDRRPAEAGARTIVAREATWQQTRFDWTRPTLRRSPPACRPRARMVLSAAMALPRGTLKVRIPDGRTLIVGGNAPGPEAELVMHNWKLPGRAFSGGTIGVAESYIDGDWESPDVTAFLELFVVNRRGRRAGRRRRQLAGQHHPARPPLAERQHAQRLAPQHLRPLRPRQRLLPRMARPDDDLFVGAVRAPAPTTSKARRPRNTARSPATPASAPDDHVLEIGCGWGGFAEFAAREIGCRVTGLTISKRAARLRARAHRQGRAFRQGRDQAAGLSRRDRQLRPHRLDRDVRGGRREILAGVLRQGEGLPQGRRHGRHADHHHQRARLPDLPQAAGLHPALRLSRRHAADAGDPQIAGRRARPVATCANASSRRTMRARWPNGASASGRPGSRSCRSASTSASSGCGSSTCTIARPASAPNTSTSGR